VDTADRSVDEVIEDTAKPQTSHERVTAADQSEFGADKLFLWLGHLGMALTVVLTLSLFIGGMDVLVSWGIAYTFGGALFCYGMSWAFR
jgi:hypothetical protein